MCGRIENMQTIYSLNIKELEDFLEQHGQKKYRAKQIYSWLYRKKVLSFDEMTDLPASFIEVLKENFCIMPLKLITKQVAKDLTAKYLFALNDGSTIETVLMHFNFGKSVCVSSQVGCNMGCSFCASGLLKKQRDLTSGEIVGEIMYIEKELEEVEARVGNIVIMGTGEPFDNYDEVMNFIYTVNEPHGLAIGARHLTISTCGLIPGIERFSNEPIQVNLAISLHAPNDEIRDELMPINKRYNMDDLRDAIKTYIERTNRRVTLEYILLKDVNDDIKYARQLAHYLRGLNVYVNLIPYNPVDEHGYKQSLGHTITAFKDELIRLHINCTLRKEHGRDIDGACGQLRAKREKGA